MSKMERGKQLALTLRLIYSIRKGAVIRNKT
jgi:hypothetical protein